MVRREAVTNRMEIPMSKSAVKKSAKRRAPKPAQAAAARPSQPSVAPAGSKQARVIAMLRSPAGTTIDAIMHATGWQQHSVRGFLAGVVRKKLKLILESSQADGNRIYRIGDEAPPKASGSRSKRRPA